MLAVDEEYRKMIEFGYLQLSVDNRIGADTITRESNKLYDASFTSICRCHDCRSADKNVVYIREKRFSNEITYPPYTEEELRRDKQACWICLECYNNRVERNNHYKGEGVFYFRDLGVVGTLKELGIGSFKELNKVGNGDL